MKSSALRNKTTSVSIHFIFTFYQALVLPALSTFCEHVSFAILTYRNISVMPTSSYFPFFVMKSFVKWATVSYVYAKVKLSFPLPRYFDEAVNLVSSAYIYQCTRNYAEKLYVSCDPDDRIGVSTFLLEQLQQLEMRYDERHGRHPFSKIIFTM